MAETFKAAFAAARKAGKKTFQWNGKPYTTELASEKSSAPASSKRPKTRSDSAASSSSPRPKARPTSESVPSSARPPRADARASTSPLTRQQKLDMIDSANGKGSIARKLTGPVGRALPESMIDAQLNKLRKRNKGR